MSNNIIHICFAKTDFRCPYCEKKYNDTEDKYLDRLNKNKCGYVTIKCECEMRFGMTVDMTGQYVGFKLKNVEL